LRNKKILKTGYIFCVFLIGGRHLGLIQTFGKRIN
jgi:hypothetical protein